MMPSASLSRRLIVAAAIMIGVAMLIVSVVIFYALHRFVQGQIDQRLDTHILFLSSMLTATPDGKLELTGTADGPPFDRRRRGWYWQISGPKNVIRSQSLDGATLDPPDISGRPLPPPPPTPPPDEERPAPRDRPVPADGTGPYEQRLHYRVKTITISSDRATIVTSAPRAAVLGPLREAMVTLGISLGALGVVLVLAMLLQVRIGLQPLERLRRSVADVRAGRSHSVPASQPLEIQPLAAELNALLEQDALNLERARKHVANLAHGLKTPLATLAIAASKASDQRDEIADLIALMERRIRHHLGRARAAAQNAPIRALSHLAGSIADLNLVLSKVNADKGIQVDVDVPVALSVACEQQDLDEMLGNLLENAFQWTRTRIDIRARSQDRLVTIDIDDDGPGLRRSQMLEAMKAGKRLDESSPGFGFGLSITRELAELYGGALLLVESPLGGLRASLSLPVA